MTLMQLNLLIALQKSGFNLTLAAEALNVVQSAGTRQLQLLEQELGMPLFERRGKRLLGFSPEGVAVLAQAYQVNLAVQNIKQISQVYHSPKVGEIKIGCTHMQAKYFLPQKLVRFKRIQPQVKIHLEQGTPKQLVEWMQQGTVDLIISTEGMEACKHLLSHNCYAWHHLLVVPPNHPILSQSLSLAEIAKYPLLTYLPGMTGHQKIMQAFADEGLKVEVDLFATDSDVIKNYVRLGFGIGIIGEMAYDPVQDQDLKAFSLQEWISSSITRVGLSSQRYYPQYVQTLVDVLKEQKARTP